ncbi:MAG: DHA2 family efflux MFS transporter permease subunit [Chloroflexi bacterium]|nr:DHA2 family efflux MFS transporter permease subunit [Chloroflexota bacterium]
MTAPLALDRHPDGHSFNLSPRQKLEILGAILLALFLFALDQTVVGTALPKISTALNGQSLYTWAFTIYLLTSTITGPIYGKLSDLYGRRPIFIWAVSLFLASSIFAGLSQEMWQFILARGLQGLAGGAVFPIALAVIADLYEPEERAKYGALFGAVFGVSSVLGPILGGFLTDNFGWPWIFFVNVPIGLVSLFVCWRLLPPIKNPEGGKNIDYVGAALFAAAIGPILVGLSNKRSLEWTDPWVGGLILLGLAMVAVFLFWESRAKDPIVRLDLFRNRTLTISVLSMFLAAFGFFGAIVFLPQWLQVVKGLGATESGLNLLPLVGALIVGATVSGQIVAKTGRYKVVILGAMVVLAVGLYLMTNLRADTSVSTVWLWMAITGLGVGPSFAVFTALVQNSVKPAVVGVATASLTFFQQIGGTIGLTIAGTILADSLTRELPARLVANGVPKQFVDQFAAGGTAGGSALDLTGTGDLGATILAGVPEAFRPLVAPLIPGIVTGIHEAFALAISSTFWVSIGAAALAAVLVLFLGATPQRFISAEEREEVLRS